MSVVAKTLGQVGQGISAMEKGLVRAGVPDRDLNDFLGRLLSSEEGKRALETAAHGFAIKPSLISKMKDGELPTWKTVRIGMHQDVAAFKVALRKGGFKISSNSGGRNMMTVLTLAKEPVELQLVRVVVAELGFLQAASRDAIYARAKEFGLKLCPAEVGPALRLTYSEQESAYGELLIAMDPMRQPKGTGLGAMGLFCLASDPFGLWLGGRWTFEQDAVTGQKLPPETTFVFCK